MQKKHNILLDIILFQIAWFACVLSSVSPFPLLLPLLGSFIILVRSASTQGITRLLPFAVSCLAMGLGGDACLVYLGFIDFSDYPSIFGVPFWMLLLWLNFGLMLHPLFEWFLKDGRRCFLGFSLGGALAYYSGHKFGVLHFEQGWYSGLAVAIEWGLASFVFRRLHLKIEKERAV